MPVGNKKVTHTCLSMCDLFVTNRHERVNRLISHDLWCNENRQVILSIFEYQLFEYYTPGFPHIKTIGGSKCLSLSWLGTGHWQAKCMYYNSCFKIKKLYIKIIFCQQHWQCRSD